MNGNHGTMNEPTIEQDGQADPNELEINVNSKNGQSVPSDEVPQVECPDSDCITNGTSCQNRSNSISEEPGNVQDDQVDSNELECRSDPNELECQSDPNELECQSDPNELECQSDPSDFSQFESFISKYLQNGSISLNNISLDSFSSNQADGDTNEYTNKTENHKTSSITEVPESIDNEVNDNAKLNYMPKDSETGTFKIVNIIRYPTDDEVSSDSFGTEEKSIAEGDTGSIVSDSDDTRDIDIIKSDNIIMLENEIDNRNGTTSLEIHEINSENSDTDDCVVTAVEKLETPKKVKGLKISPTSELRRSTRANKRKRYEDEIELDIDDESDIKDVVLQDPLQKKSRVSNIGMVQDPLESEPHVSNFNMTPKLKSNINPKKSDRVFIPFTNSSTTSKSHIPTTKSAMQQNLYQKIVARGTSVTPISSKNVETKKTTNHTTQASPVPILPTLTDDMIVVEAPSFIVPCVYEKPAVVPFKALVEKSDMDIEEAKDTEEQVLLEKKKAEEANQEQERNEKRKRGEELHESEEEDTDENKKAIVEKADKKGEENYILENEIDNRNGTSILEIHEINSDNSDTDDCVVTAVEKLKTPKKVKVLKINPTSELRRSTRAIKRKRYEDEIELDIDDESDINEVVLQDPLQSKSRVSNVGMTSKLKSKISPKKSDRVFIPFINSSATSKNIPTAKSAMQQNLYQKIAARGTSVTPISSKKVETKKTTNQNTQAAPVPILPTLTDDMFVVEAPSFIVPYVYEKPAVVPFKSFVEKWGKEIEEAKAKEEQELLEKKKVENANQEQERNEKRKRGEEFQELEEEDTDEIKKKKVEKAERKERRRRKKEDDDVSWDGSSSEESDDDSLSDDDNQAKDNIIGDMTEAVPLPPKKDSYFDLSLGKLFMEIGSNLVQEHVQTDLLQEQNRKLNREKKTGHSTKTRENSIAQLTNNLELTQTSNAPFTFEQKKCKLCSFKTESEIVLQRHLQTPHMKNNMYICNFCSLELLSPHNMLYHMEKIHGVRGILERAQAQHQCPNCPFEDHVKGKVARHQIACAKKFKPDTNLAPPVEWEHPAKILKLVRNSADGANPNVIIPIGNALTSPTFRPRASVSPMRPTGLLIRQASPQQTNLNAGTSKNSNPSILISPASRQARPIQPLNAANAKGVVMCEICDGYIKDLEQLRNHMQWIHKVKIHPKMIYNRPPLNCQKCQFRFFTDQGLERHLLGSHGLVTSAIQEAANKGKDAGRCPVCGRAYQRKLLAHVSRDHSLVLKPAHLSYKCTVCTATFGMYRQFESHVYKVHSIVAMNVADKNTKPNN